MEELIDILERFTRLDADEILFKVYQKDSFQRFVIDINTEDQLRLGLNAQGGVLGLYRSVGYSLFKDKIRGRKATHGVVDLYVSGKFYRTFKVIPLKDGFEIEAETNLYEEEDFELKYGGVVGIQDENIEKIVTFVEDEILSMLIKDLGL